MAPETGRVITSLPGIADAAEQEVIAFLRKNEPEEGYQLSFSGGKDSIVMRHLADMAGVKYTALFSCTTIDPPEVYRFIRHAYPDTVWHYPKLNYFKTLEKYGPPSRNARWCCRVLKESGDLEGKTRILMGIRAEESRKRALRQRIEKSRTKSGKIYYSPILLWKEWQIWEHIEKYQLPYPSLYDKGASRIGCKICPMLFSPSPAAQKRLERIKTLYPHFIAHFEAALRRWFERRERERETWNNTFEEWLASYYQGYRNGKKTQQESGDKIDGLL